jgi:hypothetical protein
MKLSQVGAQFYTARDHLKDATAFASTIDRLKEGPLPKRDDDLGFCTP